MNPPRQLKCETLELPTLAGTPDEPTREQQFYSCWTNAGHVRYCQTSNKSVNFFLSLKYTQNSHGLVWALMNHYLSIWCIPLNSTTFLLTQIQMYNEFKSFELISFNRSCVFQSSSSEGANTLILIFSLEHSHLEHVTWFHSSNIDNPKCIKSLPSTCLI